MLVFYSFLFSPAPTVKSCVYVGLLFLCCFQFFVPLRIFFIGTGQSLSGVAGSPAYVAPEVLTGDYSEKVDIWSAGVLLHALLVGVLPFQGDGVEAFFEAIKKVKLDFHGGVWESISGPARDLLGRMLARDVSTRITADEVLSKPSAS